MIMREIRITGKVTGVNVSQDETSGDSIYTSFVYIPQSLLTPVPTSIAIKGVHLVLGAAADITITARGEEH